MRHKGAFGGSEGREDPIVFLRGIMGADVWLATRCHEVKVIYEKFHQ
jgi:hypothetical protein